LNRGDLLLVDLVSSPAGPVFERGLFAPTMYPSKPSSERQGWRLSVLQDQQQGDGRLQMLVTLEKTLSRRETVLELLKPRTTWLEVPPAASSATPTSQRWNYQPGYPAPAWNIDVPAWPGRNAAGPAQPRLRAWWNPDQEPVLAAALDRGADFQSLG